MEWYSEDADWAKSFGIAQFDHKELRGLMRCACKWPNYNREGTCIICGRAEGPDADVRVLGHSVSGVGSSPVAGHQPREV